MRWSKLILSLGILSAASLVGCRKESSSDKQQTLPPAQSQMKQQDSGQMQTRGLQPSRTDDGNKIVIATPKQCYTDLCESNRELDLLKLMADAEKGSPAQQEYYKKYVHPLVIETMKQKANASRAAIAIIEKYKGEFQNLKLNEIQKRLLVSMYYILRPQKLDLEGRVQIDKILSKLPLAKASSGAYIKGAKSYLEVLHPGIEIQKAAQLEAQYIDFMQTKLNEVSEMKIIAFSFPGFQRALKGETVGREDMNEIVNYGAYMRKLEALILGPAKDAVDKLGYSEADFFKTYKTAKLEKQYDKVEDYKPLDAAKCEASFYQSINLAPKKEEIEKFDDLKNQVKKASLSLLSPSDPAYAVVEKTDFYLPYNSEESVGLWRDAFKEEIRKDKASVARSGQFGAIEAYVLAITNSLTAHAETKLCDGMYDPNLIDSITPEDGASRLSWMTVRYPQYGITVLAHEIAHVVFHHSTHFESEKQCINKQNNSDKYTKEDFADLLAIRTEVNLEKSGMDLTGKKANVGCLFASTRIGESFMNTTPEDTHSSHLSRAVKFALYRKQELPASCKALARAEKSNVLNSCDQ